MKRIAVAVTALAVAAVVAGSAAATARHANATVLIRHQTRGCHTWSYAGTGWHARLSITLDRDTKALSFVNNDVMPHRLIQLRGPHATISHAYMRHMSARAVVRFSRAGTYVFGTKAGEDYPNMHMSETVAKDNVLRLTVGVP